MVAHDAFIGDYKKKSLNFQHLNLEEISLKVQPSNGVQTGPSWRKYDFNLDVISSIAPPNF